MKKSIAFASSVIVLFFVTACNNSSTTESNNQEMVMSDSTSSNNEKIKKVPVKYTNLNATKMMKNLSQHYVHLKNALVSGNGAEAQNGAKGMLEVIQSFDKSTLTSEQKIDFDKHIAAVTEDAKHISENKEIAEQREHLVGLSDHMHSLVMDFGAGQPMYYAFCSMADNNNGAYWLSESEEIKNPYYGSDMLSCGSVMEEIK